MLPSPTLPATWRGLLEMFRPAFRRSRTFGLFVLRATGLVAQTARRTLVGMLVGAGVAAVVSFHACCRFFSHHRWDVDRIGLVPARLIVDRLLDAGAPIVVVDITKNTMRAAFAAYAATHEPASIRRCWSTWNVLCDFLYTAELIAANPMPFVGRPKAAKTLPRSLPSPRSARCLMRWRPTASRRAAPTGPNATWR